MYWAALVSYQYIHLTEVIIKTGTQIHKYKKLRTIDITYGRLELDPVQSKFHTLLL